MSSPASVKKHPLHPMLVGLPIGLWTFALVCDLVHAVGGGQGWAVTAIYCIGGGIVGALLAAVPGFIDYLSIDEPAMKRIATLHLSVNLGAVVVFAANLWFRLRVAEAGVVPLILSLIGIAVLSVGGWLGGEMVYVKGMAVEAVEELAKKADKPGPRRAA